MTRRIAFCCSDAEYSQKMSCINICFVPLRDFLFLFCVCWEQLIMADRSYFILSFMSTVLHLCVRINRLRILFQPHLDNQVFVSFKKLTHWIWTYWWSEAVFPCKKWQLWDTSKFLLHGDCNANVVEQWFHLFSDALFVFTQTIKGKCAYSAHESSSPPFPPPPPRFQ